MKLFIRIFLISFLTFSNSANASEPIGVKCTLTVGSESENCDVDSKQPCKLYGDQYGYAEVVNTSSKTKSSIKLVVGLLIARQTNSDPGNSSISGFTNFDLDEVPVLETTSTLIQGIGKDVKLGGNISEAASIVCSAK